VTVRVYHAPSPEDPSPSDEPSNLTGSTDCKLEEMKSQHAPAREEHLLACANHALVYRVLRKIRLVAAEVEDDNERPREAHGMHRMAGNHTSSLKKWPKN
jgi:hypothetical protein